MGLKRLVLGAMLTFLMLPAAWSQEGWVPFPVFWDDGSGTVTHVGNLLLDPPAGKHGFLTVQGDAFRFQDSTPARFWGINLSAGANFPDHEVAERVASRLAKLGVNLVRLHHMDSAYEPRGIWDAHFKDTRHLSPQQLDRLDYLIAQLKSRGIYVDLNLHVGRPFTEADGVVEARLLPRLAKFVTLFDRQLINLQKEYARQLLTHRNPYTGREYRNEPAVALLELTNENSLFAGWLNGALDREEETITRPVDPWRGPIPTFYRRELDRLWNRWLLSRYRDRITLQAAWTPVQGGQQGLTPDEDPQEGTVRRIPWSERERYTASRIADLARFYAELEIRYFKEMINYLREEIGVRIPITGTNNFYGLPSIYTQSIADYMDTHGYWDHPTFPRRPWDRTDFRISNRSLVLNPTSTQRTAFNSSPIPRWTLSAVCGKPLTVSEWNQAFPNVYEYEMPLLVAAYGAFQGWDGLFAYTYRHDRENWNRQGIFGWFDLDANPVKLTLLSAGAFLFLRGDVSSARQTVEVLHTEDDIFGRFRDSGATPSHGPNFPMTLAFRHRVCQRFGGVRSEATRGVGVEMPHGLFASDTGELAWDGDAGVVRINTPRTQGAVGFLARGPVSLQDVRIRSETDAAIVLTSVDGRPLADSRKMLLVAAARQANTGQRWQEDGRGLLSWGTGPVLVQPVKAEITLLRASALRVFALDSRGERLREVAATCHANGCSFSLGDPGALWFELVRP